VYTLDIADPQLWSELTGATARLSPQKPLGPLLYYLPLPTIDDSGIPQASSLECHQLR
jgi:hypothetical protein